MTWFLFFYEGSDSGYWGQTKTKHMLAVVCESWVVVWEVLGGVGGGDTAERGMWSLIPGAGAPGEATVSHPSSYHITFWIRAARTSEPPAAPTLSIHPALLFFSPPTTTLSSISPGGRAHFGRGMQRLISNTWTVEPGAAAARHSSTSWRHGRAHLPSTPGFH